MTRWCEEWPTSSIDWFELDVIGLLQPEARRSHCLGQEKRPEAIIPFISKLVPDTIGKTAQFFPPGVGISTYSRAGMVSSIYGHNNFYIKIIFI